MISDTMANDSMILQDQSQPSILAAHIKFELYQHSGVRGIFFRGGKVGFPDFFHGVKYTFPVEIFHFGTPYLPQFSFFSSTFSFLYCLYFPGRSVKNFQWKGYLVKIEISANAKWYCQWLMINPRLTKLFFVTRLTTEDCYNPYELEK